MKLLIKSINNNKPQKSTYLIHIFDEKKCALLDVDGKISIELLDNIRIDFCELHGTYL